MAVLSFYWPNIIAGCILVFALGHLGRHLMARNKSMEVMLLGQEFQTGILISAFILSLIEAKGDHTEHGFHIETLISLLIVFVFHYIYSTILRKYNSYRVEGALASIVMLMGVGHIIVMLSPVVEFHMVKSFLGDIVTVSKVESLTVCVIAILVGVGFFLKRRQIFLDTIEIALFNRPTKKRRSYLLFNIYVFVLMLFSVHLFGGLFTVGSILIPSLFTSLFGVPEKKFNYLMGINVFSVLGAFGFLLVHDRLPTTVVILFILFILSFFYSLLNTEK